VIAGRRLRAIALAVVVLVILGVLAGLVWAHTVMAGDRSAALDVWRNDAITVTSTEEAIILAPSDGDSTTGLVFVPGAKVDPYAYMYKLSGIVEDGTTVVITKPTLNLAIADLRPLDAFTSAASGVDQWFVGGHSLGGVKACQYAADNETIGLVLFGSYCSSDLSDSGLPVLSFVGENDGLSTPEKIADAAGTLPDDAVTVEIPGANHADFGDYGVQPGDGESEANESEVRQTITVEFRAWAAATAG
jgi:hypothetical protein